MGTPASPAVLVHRPVLAQYRDELDELLAERADRLTAMRPAREELRRVYAKQRAARTVLRGQMRTFPDVPDAEAEQEAQRRLAHLAEKEAKLEASIPRERGACEGDRRTDRT